MTSCHISPLFLNATMADQLGTSTIIIVSSCCFYEFMTTRFLCRCFPDVFPFMLFTSLYSVETVGKGFFLTPCICMTMKYFFNSPNSVMDPICCIQYPVQYQNYYFRVVTTLLNQCKKNHRNFYDR